MKSMGKILFVFLLVLFFAAITHWHMVNHAPFNGEGERSFIKLLNGEDWGIVAPPQAKEMN